MRAASPLLRSEAISRSSPSCRWNSASRTCRSRSIWPMMASPHAAMADRGLHERRQVLQVADARDVDLVESRLHVTKGLLDGERRVLEPCRQPFRFVHRSEGGGVALDD